MALCGSPDTAGALPAHGAVILLCRALEMHQLAWLQFQQMSFPHTDLPLPCPASPMLVGAPGMTMICTTTIMMQGLGQLPSGGLSLV